jgi:hypothetical protein
MKSGLQGYSGGGASLNAKLRKGESPGSFSETLKNLDAAFASDAATLPSSVMVRREFGSDHPLAEMLEDDTLTPGTVYQDPGFQSTSVQKNWHWSGGYVLHLRVPGGVPNMGIYLAKTEHGSNTGYESEKELLLNRNVKVRVLSFNKATHLIEAEVIPAEED